MRTVILPRGADPQTRNRAVLQFIGLHVDGQYRAPAGYRAKRMHFAGVVTALANDLTRGDAYCLVITSADGTNTFVVSMSSLYSLSPTEAH